MDAGAAEGGEVAIGVAGLGCGRDEGCGGGGGGGERSKYRRKA